MKAFYNKAIVLLFILFISLAANAQIKFGDNKTTINTASLLELETTNKGVLFPRISLSTTTTWGLAGSGTAAMMVYNTNTGITSSNTSYPILPGGKGMYYWDGTGWLAMTYPVGVSNGQYWNLKGNLGNKRNLNFLGTTDTAALIFKVNSILAGMIEGPVWSNTLLGYQAGLNMASSSLGLPGVPDYGSSNVMIGYQAGLTNTTGSFNTLAGYKADVASAALYNANAIGYSSVAGASNTLVLGGIKSLNSAAVQVGIGTSTPGAMLDIQDSTFSQQNMINGVGSVNNYLQLNIQNRNTGNNASGDIVATADNGTAATHYIDMGINSSGYTQNNWGYANGAYLYASDDTLRIGTQAAGKPLIFNTAGAVSANERMRIDPAGNVGIGTTNPLQKLHISGTSSSTAIGSTGTNLVTPTIRIDGLNTTNNPGVHGSDAEPKAVYATTNGDLVLVPSDSILVSNDDFIPNGSPVTLNFAASGTGILTASSQLYTTNFTLGRRALVQLNYSVDLTVADYNGGAIGDGSARLMQSWMNIINTAGPVTVKSVVGNSSSTFTSSLGTGTVVSGILYNNGAYSVELPAGTYTLQIYGDVYTGNGKGVRVIYGAYSLDEVQIVAHYK